MIDAHAHLTDARFAADLDAVLARAVTAGLARILTCAEDVADAERALELARRYPLLRVAVGIHPHRAAGCDDAAIARLRDLAADPRVVAIGEIGIDLSGRSATREAQEAALERQLALAIDLDLPVVLHMRDASEELRAVVDGAAPDVRGQLHCYSDSADEVLGWTARGLWLSFAGTVTFEANDALREAARLVPGDRLLAETDAPYLAPEPRRGKRNEPAFVADTIARLAQVRGATPPEVAAQIDRNARALFGARWG